MQVNIKNKGFTLLEVLLVIALIGILIGTILVSVNPNRQLAQARNLTRKSDITDIYNALEAYSVKNSANIVNTITTSYQEICDTGTRSTTNSLPSATYCDNKIDLRLLVPTYITSIPKDSRATGVANTGYEVAKTNTNQISIKAKNPELGESIVINPIN
jgi:prepilin-type N-terminal cleavage/methylation domain-containing protein